MTCCDDWQGRKKVAVVLSLGGGVQSSVLALMSAHGDLPRLDCAIFADTRWESEAVYDHLDWLEAEVDAAPHPFALYRVSNGNLRHAVMHSAGGGKGHVFSPIPGHVAGGGMRKRQCTSQYKIRPIERRLRLLYAPRAGKEYIEQWMGISLDEIQRMKASRTQWIRNMYPLIARRMSRAACLSWFERRYPRRALVKSACVGCPYHSRAHWQSLRRRSPRDFADCVAVEKAMQSTERIHGHRQSYLHSAAIPLEQAVPDIRDAQIPLFGGDDECGGHCFT